ncbi:DUF3298 domain-containing protein [uncultured Hyphomonas sp.]|uniref:DUF3298 and DUF4163 domain-containing protein n=1 Tax=uncultured Hyphomonas sp. TaxID=225298 RepID=UPI002AAB2573|nr:DUF3298 domain-containing protein [uncultured Hyphomonas sp.]
MKQVLLLSAALMLAVVPAACGQAAGNGEGPETVVRVAGTGESSTPPEAASTADMPRSLLVDNDALKADVKFEEAIFALAPGIAADLIDDANSRIEVMQEDADTYKEADPEFFRPYGLKIDWRVTGAAGSLAGLEGFIFTFTGGAHGNYMTDARIYNAETGKRMHAGDLFTDQAAATAALSPDVFGAIATAKAERSGSPESRATFLGEVTDALAGTSLLSGEVSLIASTEEDKLGGIVLHYAPYEVGSYAEGAYHITLPQAGFRDLLKPDYAGLFGGEPADLQRFGD